MSQAGSFHPFLAEHGARLGDFFGGPAALDFGDTASEYQALVTGVGVVERAAATRIRLTGADRTRLLHNLCTADVNKLPPGHGCEAFVTNVKGHAIGHGIILCGEEWLDFSTVAGQAETLLPHIDKYIIREDVAVAEITAEVSELLLAGPQAQATLTQVLRASPPDEMLEFQFVSLDNVPITVGRVDLLPGAYSISCPADRVVDLWQQLVATGATPCGQLAADVLRIEHGYPHFGRDVTEANLPQEVDRNDLAISFTKGCYLGQETIARLDALGHVNKTLVRLRGTGDEVPAPGAELHAGEKAVGQITSSAWSHGCQAPVALGYVRSGPNSAGTQLICGTQTLEVQGSNKD